MASEDVDLLSEDEIAGMKLKQTNAMLKKYGVMQESENLDDMKRALSMKMLELSGNCRSFSEIHQVVTSIKDMDESKRDKLAKIFELVQDKMDIIHEYHDDPLADHLENRLPDHIRKLQKEKEQLNSQKCPILFAGETSAGKSSLLNLILGIDLLPTSHLSNTSVICEISYGTTRWARIHYWEKSTPPIIINDGPNFVQKLAEYVHDKENRGANMPFKKAEIYIPSDLLKSGLFIVDSPGIGENKHMTQLVLDYLLEAFAFIYVINSANAGGVQADRMLLRQVVERQKKDHQHFPQAAIFVCNKWDVLRTTVSGERERRKVKEDTLRKLKECWPDCSGQQVFFLSVKEANYAKQQGYISKDFTKLLDGLMSLLPASLDAKLNYYYSTLEKFINNVIQQLQAFISQSTKTKEERIEVFSEISKRLQKLIDEADNYIKSKKKSLDGKHYIQAPDFVYSIVTHMLSDKNAEAVALLQAHFKNPEVKEAILNAWKVDKLPVCRSWPEIDWTVRKKLKECIHHQLVAWEAKNDFFSGTSEEMIKEYSTNFLDLSEKVGKIELMICKNESHSRPTSVASSDSRQTTDEDATSISSHEDLETMDVNQEDYDIPKPPRQASTVYDMTSFLSRLGHKEKIFLGVAAPVFAPVALVVSIIGLPVLGAIEVKKKIVGTLHQQELAKFRFAPLQYVQKHSEKVLDDFLKKRELQKYVYSQLKPIHEALETFRKGIPEQIEADRRMVEALKTDDRDAQQYLKTYPNIEAAFRAYQEHLKLYWIMNLHRNPVDINWNLLDFNPGQKPVCIGLHTTIWHGALKVGSECGSFKIVKVSVAKRNVPLTERNVANYLQEENCRRIKKGKIMAVFMGVTKDPTAIYTILEPFKCSLRDQVYGSKLWHPDTKDDVKFETVKGYMTQVVRGLQYLHGRRMTHFDLSLDTVAVTDQGDIKLTNMSTERIVTFNDNVKTVDDLLQYNHLATEVLNSMATRRDCVENKLVEYDKSCDMYSVGIMMWELWCGQRAYDTEIRSIPLPAEDLLAEFGTITSRKRPRLNVFYREHEETLRPVVTSTHAGKWRDVINTCWEFDKENRIQAKHWQAVCL